MQKIKKLVKNIDEELCGAKRYAECYVEKKAEGNQVWANRFKEMSNDELKHATYLHDFVVATIEEVSKVFKAPIEMEEAWEKSHAEYVEKVAWIKQMLTM